MSCKREKKKKNNRKKERNDLSQSGSFVNLNQEYLNPLVIGGKVEDAVKETFVPW